jgi:hypothetical protein
MAKSRWLDWEPGTPIMDNSSQGEPTKPSKHGSAGFEGSAPGKILIIRNRILDGYQVERVIWETPKAVVFEDDAGRFWRYLHAYRKAWPVIVGK